MSGNGNDELAKILEAITINTDISLAGAGDEKAFERLVAKAEDLPDNVKEWVEAEKLRKAAIPPVDVPPVDAPPVDTPPVDTPPVDTPPADTPPVTTEPHERPLKDNFDDELEFAKALVSWDRAEQVKAKPYNVYKAPTREDFHTQEEFDAAKTSYEGFLSAVKKSVFGETFEGMEINVGEALKKSLVPHAIKPKKVNYMDLYKKAGESASLDELLSKVDGV